MGKQSSRVTSGEGSGGQKADARVTLPLDSASLGLAFGDDTLALEDSAAFAIAIVLTAAVSTAAAPAATTVLLTKSILVLVIS